MKEELNWKKIDLWRVYLKCSEVFNLKSAKVVDYFRFKALLFSRDLFTRLKLIQGRFFFTFHQHPPFNTLLKFEWKSSKKKQMLKGAAFASTFDASFILFNEMRMFFFCHGLYAWIVRFSGHFRSFSVVFLNFFQWNGFLRFTLREYTVFLVKTQLMVRHHRKPRGWRIRKKVVVKHKTFT